MNAVRIRKKIESSIAGLPELDPMVGKTVEIIVLEEPEQAPQQTRRVDLSGFDAVRREGGYDFDAVERLREISKL